LRQRPIDVKNDIVGVLDGKAAIFPGMIFERHDGNQTGSDDGNASRRAIEDRICTPDKHWHERE
jgi:hypothetical protein